MQPARFHGSDGRDFHIAVFGNFKSKPRQKVHPAFRLKLQIAEMRKAWNRPGIVRHEDVEARIAFCKHHLAHLFSTFMERPERAMFTRFQPLTDTFVKTFSQCLLICRHITNKEIAKFIERCDINRGARTCPKAGKLTAFANALRGFHAASDRTRKVHGIAKRRNHFSKRHRLTSPAIRKPYMRAKILVARRDVVALGMAQQQINFRVPVSLGKKVRKLYEVVCHRSLASNCSRQRNPDSMSKSKAQDS